MASSQETAGLSRSGRVPIYKDLVLLQLVALVFLFDQFTKFLVREFLPFHSSWPRDGFFRITHTHNTGSAFGLFQDQNTPLIFASLVGVVVLVLIYRNQERLGPMLRLSIGLMLGGATGNLLDRLCLVQQECRGSFLSRFGDGYVTDFMDVGAWPVFNVADSSIVTGLVILGWLFLVHDSGGESHCQMETLPATSHDSHVDRRECRVCDEDMVTLYGGLRCSSCGFKERNEVDARA